jgi:hypothetical protein
LSLMENMRNSSGSSAVGSSCTGEKG